MKTTVIKIASVFILITLIFFTCIKKVRENKKEYIVTFSVCNNFYVEKYQILSWGALSADLYSNYLTDSISFRIFVGTYDNDQRMLYECKEDSLIVKKVNRNNPATIYEYKVFSVKTLKKYNGIK